MQTNDLSTEHSNLAVVKEVFIPVIPPSQNDFMGIHWAVYRKKYYKPWEMNLLLVGWGKNEGKLRTIEFIHCRKNQAGFYDDANFNGGLKPIVDILKLKGWMKDDKPKYYRGIYRQKTITEMNDPKIREEGLYIRIFAER